MTPRIDENIDMNIVGNYNYVSAVDSKIVQDQFQAYCYFGTDNAFPFAVTFRSGGSSGNIYYGKAFLYGYEKLSS